MHVGQLELEEFRSYRRLQLNFDPVGLRLVGDNATGKSTLLEAIAMLATTRSMRTASERELINWRSGEELSIPPYARLRGVVARTDRTVEIEIGLQIDPTRPSHIKKQVRLNGRPVRATDAVGVLNAVLFSPEDIDLVSGSPSGRRRYLDLTISQLDTTYLRSLTRFNRVVEQRNSLLKSLGGSGLAAGSRQVAEQLGFWDAELVAHGSAVVARRVLAVRRLATLTAEQFRQLSSRDDLVVGYESTIPLPPEQHAGHDGVASLQAVVARNFEAALAESGRDELRRGATLLGPHRDDMTFRLDQLDVSLYGSRGQQRLVVVALKLAIAELMRERAGEPPVLMLDDVLSELDQNHRVWVLDTVAGMGTQVILTATDAEPLRRPALDGIPAARTAEGAVCGLELT